MFFIDFGQVEMWSATMTYRYLVLEPGSFFGELSLLTRERHTANAKAVSYTELWSLSRDNLDRLVADAPMMEAKMRKFAHTRLLLQLEIESQARPEDDDESDEDEVNPLPFLHASERCTPLLRRL